MIHVTSRPLTPASRRRNSRKGEGADKSFSKSAGTAVTASRRRLPFDELPAVIDVAARQDLLLRPTNSILTVAAF